MAKKAVELVDVAEELDDLSPEEQDVLAALSDLEGSQDARWQVSREAPGAGKPEGYLDTLSTSEVRMDEIKRRFGRGNYKIKGLRADGTYLKQLRVKIATDPELAPVAEKPSGTDAITLFMEREEKRSERNRELMLAVVPGAVTAIAGIFTAVLSRQQPQQNILQDLATLKTVIGPPPERDSPTELMIKMLELGKKYGDKGGGSDSWLDVVKEAVQVAGPMLVEKLQAAPSNAQQPVPNPPYTQIPAPSPTNPYLPKPDTHTQAKGDDVNALKMMQLANWAREKLTYLASKAAKNSDPELYADWLIDEVPEGIDIREFAQYLEHADWWQYLQQFCPAVTPYQGWFSEFRDLLIDTVQEMFQSPEAPAPIETKPEDFEEPKS